MSWTYGAEHELVDWPRDRSLPMGCTALTNEYSIVNSTGIATDARQDPGVRLYHFGHEINTPATFSRADQVGILQALMETLPESTVNYRSELNLHIRVPGLSEDLAALKRLAAYNADCIAEVLQLIDPLPTPTRAGHSDDEWLGEQRNYRTRRGYQHIVLPPDRSEKMAAAMNLDAFFEAEVPRTKMSGRPMWHAQPRAAVNVRQLKQTDTIEFRHFPGTTDPTALQSAFWWCDLYLRAALDDGPRAIDLWACAPDEVQSSMPTQMPYHHWMERRFRATCHDGSLTKAQIAANIQAIEAGTFDSQPGVPNRLPLTSQE